MSPYSKATGLPLSDKGQFLPGYDYSAEARAIHAAQLAEERAEVQSAFLEAYKKTFNFSRAAEIAGGDRISIYRWAREDAEFRQRVNDARQYCLDNIEGALYDKALSGGKGSETAAIMLLNARRSKVFKGNNKNADAGGGNMTINFIMGVAPENLPAPSTLKLPAQSGHEIILDDDADA